MKKSAPEHRSVREIVLEAEHNAELREAYELCEACTEFGHFVDALRSFGPWLLLDGNRFDSSTVVADCCDRMPKKIIFALAAQGGVHTKRKWCKRDIVEAIVDDVERVFLN